MKTKLHVFMYKSPSYSTRHTQYATEGGGLNPMFRYDYHKSSSRFALHSSTLFYVNLGTIALSRV